MTNLTNYDFLYHELYDPQKSGVVLMKKILGPNLVRGIHNELEQNIENFRARPTRYGTTQQELHTWDFERSILRNHAHLTVLDYTYASISKHLHARMENAMPVDEIKANSSLYKAGAVGIGPHRDNSFSVNFTLICVISGSNPFFTAKDKEKNGEVRLDAEPGDLILLRGPRELSERGLRPIHYVKEIIHDRFIVVFREVNHELLHKIGRNNQYNA